jgi:hypothetical protein
MATLLSKLMKHIGFTGSVAGGMSAIILVTSGFEVGWTAPYRKVLEQYFVITNNL